MATITPIPTTTPETTEAYETLLARVGKRSPKIPAEVLVRHVMNSVPGHEWPVRVEALDALLRRLESARKDGLRIDGRPAEGQLLGTYATRRRGSGARPYTTVLTGVDPLEGRCDCPDFGKNSLGLCKHLLVVAEHLFAKPGRARRALREQQEADTQASASSGLSWDPVRPLTGLGDWLERVVFPSVAEAKGRLAERWSQARKWFRPGAGGALVLKATYPDEPEKRLALVEDLLKVVPPPSPNETRHDPALRALLVGERDRLKWIVKQAVIPGELRGAMKGLKRPLYPYQREGVERFLARGRLLLADDMGLGKTAQAIAASDILWRTRRVRRGLIIAPAALKPQWAREWNVFSDLPARVVEGTPSERQEAYDSCRSGFLIINYEQLIRDLEMIRRWSPDLVVLDEAQRIKNWATKTALSVKGLAPPYRLVLTGTPMENRIDELASVVEWVDDFALEPKWRLGALHAVRADGRREVTGVRYLDTLRQRLRGCMVRRVRQDVLDQLPPRTDTRVPIEMTEAQLEEHDALNQPIAQLVQRTQQRPLTQAEFLRLISMLTTQRVISNGLAQLHFEDVWPTIRTRTPEESVIASLSSPKLLELRQLARQLIIDQGRKVVIFSQWRRMLTLAHWAIHDLLEEHGLRAGFFTGAEGQRRRTQNIVEFHDDPDHRVLFASDAGAVGLNLQRASNCVINLELPWNPAVLEQRIGRVYRLGQTQPIDAYNLVCEEGIESRIASLVGAKQAFFKGLFDGDTDTVQFEQSSSFLARVRKLYEPAELESAAAGGDEGELAEAGDDLDLDLDDEVGDPLDQLLDAADESQDEAAVPAPGTNGRAEPVAAPVPTPAPVLTAPPDGGIAVAGAVGERPAAPADVRRLFSQLQVRRAEDGKVVIEAPAEAASTLSALFEGMAALLQSVAGPQASDQAPRSS